MEEGSWSPKVSSPIRSCCSRWRSCTRPSAPLHPRGTPASASYTTPGCRASGRSGHASCSIRSTMPWRRPPMASPSNGEHGLGIQNPQVMTTSRWASKAHKNKTCQALQGGGKSSVWGWLWCLRCSKEMPFFGCSLASNVAAWCPYRLVYVSHWRGTLSNWLI